MLITPLKPTLAPILRTPVGFTTRSPTSKHRRTNSLKRYLRRRIRPLPRLLRTNHHRPLIKKRSPQHRRIIRPHILRTHKHRILTNPITVRMTPKLPISHLIRTTTSKTLRNQKMLSNPRIPKIPKRRKINIERTHYALNSRLRLRCGRSSTTGRNSTGASAIRQPLSRRPAGVRPN